MKNFNDPKKAKALEWIVNYLVEEEFPNEHLNALCKIISMFNWDEKSEAEVFEFAKQLYEKNRTDKEDLMNKIKEKLNEADHECVGELPF